MSKKLNLKPCPFCGSTNIEYKKRESEELVICDQCFPQGKLHWHDGERFDMGDAISITYLLKCGNKVLDTIYYVVHHELHGGVHKDSILPAPLSIFRRDRLIDLSDEEKCVDFMKKYIMECYRNEQKKSR